jgi:hypothetical protein
MKTLKKRFRSLIFTFLLPLKKYVNKTTYFRVTTVKSLQIFTENSLKKKKRHFHKRCPEVVIVVETRKTDYVMYKKNAIPFTKKNVQFASI